MKRQQRRRNSPARRTIHVITVERRREIDAAQLVKLMALARLTHRDVAEELRISTSSVTNKLVGRRPWHADEVDQVLALLSARLKRRIPYEKAFGRRGAA